MELRDILIAYDKTHFKRPKMEEKLKGVHLYFELILKF